MNKYVSLSFDEVFCNKHDTFIVDSIFGNSINLKNIQQEVLTLTNRKGIMRSIYLDPFENIFSDFLLGDNFILDGNLFFNDKIQIQLPLENSRTFFWDFTTAKISFLQKNLKRFFDSIESPGILQIFKQKRTIINQFLFQKIQNIDLKHYNISSFAAEIVKLYSGGIGSTPSVDDMILGMIITAQHYKDPVDIFRNSYHKTTLISQNMLLNALHNKVSDNVRDLYENGDPDKMYHFADQIGSCSGIDMLVGTYLYTQKKGGRSCFAN